MMSHATITGIVILAVVLAAGGCDRPAGLVSVHGRVTFAGKPPPAAVAIIFLPREMQESGRDDGRSSRVGVAAVDADGFFEAGTFRLNDGLRPGTYDVQISCDQAQSSADGHEQAPSHVPRSFVAPVLVVPVDDGGSVRYTVDVR
jgi:hypothetical protein